MTRPVLVFLLLLAACGAGAACAQTSGGFQEPASTGTSNQDTKPAEITISSPAFAANMEIPTRYTCQGDDVSPAVEWTASPAGTKSLALILDDPDAPAGTWVHWVVYNLPPDANGLTESASQGKSTAANLPQGAVQGENSFNRVNYGGPCPPSGEHHYIFHLYALDTTLSGDSLDKTALLKAMNGHILAQGELTGLYQKK